MNTFLLIMQLFPLILAAIQQIEATAQVPKVGPAKLTLLTKTVSAAYHASTFEPAVISQDSLIALIESITADVVAFYNLVGIFKTTA